MSYFSIFATLYMASFLAEMTERWKYPGFTWLFLILISLLVFNRITRRTFFLFLIASTTYIVLFRFPEVANHVNLILLLNLTLMIGILWTWRYPTSTDDDYFNMMLPFLRVSFVLIYLLAGFHKLNWDFFHPDVSCAGGLLVSGFVPILTSTTLGIPSPLLLIASLTLLVTQLWGNPVRSLPKWVQFTLLALITLVMVVLASFFILMQGQFPAGFKATAIVSLAVVVIAWELVGGLLLMLPKLQGPILLFSWMMHVSLALIGFVDFGTLAFALLFTFIPPTYLRLLDEHPHVQIGKYQIHRVHGYFWVLLLSSALAGIHYQLDLKLGDIKFLNGLLLFVGVLLLIWPILQRLCSAQRLPWSGVPLVTQQTHPLVIGVFILLICFYGITPYLGLRTAGNFSMFSNLRTEGSVSNHLLLGNNPLKIWGYQEDVVTVLGINDEAAELGHKYVPLKGQQLPVVEFKKLIYKWTQANYVVPLQFDYQGQRYTTPNIVTDPIWQTPQRSWEMVLMDFRVIQTQGPNQCRW